MLDAGEKERSAMGRTRTSTPYRRTALDRVRLPSFATNAKGEGVEGPQGIEPCSCAGRAHALTIVLRARGGLVGGGWQQVACDYNCARVLGVGALEGR